MILLKWLKSKLAHYLPLKTGGFGYFLFFLQFFYLYQVFVSNDIGGFGFSIAELSAVAFSTFSVFFFFQWVSALTSHKRSYLVSANILLLILYGVLVGYHFQSQQLLDFSVVIDNFSIGFSGNALEVILSSIELDAMLYILLFIVIFLPLEWKRKTISNSTQSNPKPKIIVGGLLYLALIIAPLNSYDPYLNFFKTVQLYFFPKISISVELPKNHSHPFLNDGRQFQHISVLKPGEKKPYVFVIMVESLNASALEKKNSTGDYVLPFLRSLRDQSIYAPSFYGNSIQTAKGHFATLFSAIPSTQGKAFVRFKDLPIDSIATALKKDGYETTYFSAFHNKNFDNEYDFLTARGFDSFEVIKPYLTEEDLDQKLRWGVEDSVFYKRFFEVLEKKIAVTPSLPPQFYVLTTIANHFPFNSVPEQRQFIHRPSDSFTKDYENSVHLSDKGIELFFKELDRLGIAEQSLVIITGDHAFPMGEHRNYHLEAGYHEESFRIPFFMVWKSKLPHIKLQHAYSQMDIGPTIFDILDTPVTQNTFQGVSMFDPAQKDHPIFLIQPYGKHLSVIRYPYKYRFHTKTGTEYVYHLENDPMETTSILSKIPASLRRTFHTDLSKIYLHQKWIEKATKTTPAHPH